MAQYTNITQKEMEDFLLPQKFIKISLPNTVELVYAKRVDVYGLSLSLRIYTGIANGSSRQSGDDAIRCDVFWKKPDGTIKLVFASKRVHRVSGWKKNLQDRIDNWKIGPPCPKCEAPMIERSGKNGNFYGCVNYPQCNGTRAIVISSFTE